MRLPVALQTLVGFALLVACGAGVLALVRGRPAFLWELSGMRSAAVIVLLCACWLLTNGPTEGRVLWSPTSRHGLTAADLWAVPPLLLAILLVLRRS